MVTETPQDFQASEIDQQVGQLKTMVLQAAQDGMPAHMLEGKLFTEILKLGRALFAAFLEAQPSDDLGPTVELPNGRTLRRCNPQQRRVVTVFGEFVRDRIVYATRQGQAAELIPFDQRLALPEDAFSYLLQDWSNSLAVDVAFKPVVSTLARFLGIKLTVDSAEQICRRTADASGPFEDSRRAPAPEAEGPILVATIDHKGIPMIGAAVSQSAHRTKGQKPKKRMAAVGCVYSAAPHVRTPEELTEILFRESRPAVAPPRPQQRRYWTSLSHEIGGVAVCGQNEVLNKMGLDVALRRQPGQILVYLTDGQRSLETGGRACLPRDAETVEVLDLLHVTPRLWEAAHLFHAEGSPAAAAFVREKVLQVLRGQSAQVVAQFRQLGERAGLRGQAKSRLTIVCNFLISNLRRMRYDEYLAAGYPIATGVIEGACRHIIKDRMERTGMRWTIAGAQSMLWLRTTQVNGCWDEYCAYRIETETHRLYPYQELLPPTPYAVAA